MSDLGNRPAGQKDAEFSRIRKVRIGNSDDAAVRVQREHYGLRLLIVIVVAFMKHQLQLIAPGSHGVKLFKAEADWVHQLMTSRTGLLGGVRRHTFSIGHRFVLGHRR